MLPTTLTHSAKRRSRVTHSPPAAARTHIESVANETPDNVDTRCRNTTKELTTVVARGKGAGRSGSVGRLRRGTGGNRVAMQQSSRKIARPSSAARSDRVAQAPTVL